jgi:energy-coupling factor transporter transmembrane protein EcfT
VRIGPNQRTPREIVDQLLDARREYNDGRELLIQRSITTIESKRNPLLALLFVGLVAIVWIIAIVSELRIEWLWNWFQLVPATIIFLISYFAFFHVSKLVIKASTEESTDDTSYLALFSACDSRARRGWYSAIFGVLNTGALLFCLIYKEVNWTDVFY